MEEKTLLSVLGKAVLLGIQDIYFDFLKSSAAIYEGNGDYAIDIYASKYCELLNEASKKLPRHLCHEDCWATSLEAIKTAKPCEKECTGGIVIHAAPIISEGKAIGSNNAGISNPPTDIVRIREIAEKFQLDDETVLKAAKEYATRPQYIIEAAGRQIDSAATLISELFRTQEKLKENEEIIRESEQRWATILESIGDAVMATDLTGRVIFMNRVAQNLTGWSLSEALNKPLREVFRIINEYTRQEAEDPTTKVIEKGIIIGLANHTILKRRDGTEIPIDDSGAPIKNRNGKITGVVLVFRDITERRKADEALQRQADLLNLDPDAIIVKKLDDTIIFWSKGAEKLYGWTMAEAMGQKTRMLFKTRLPRPLREIIGQLKREGQWSGEVIHKTKHERDVVVRSWWRAKLDWRGEVVEILESNVDITESKKMKNKLEEYSKHLEKLVDEKAKQLMEAERLAAIGATAGMVGHDIRNPLQTISGALFLMGENIESLSESAEKDDLKELIESVDSSVQYINKIVADLQDFGRPIRPELTTVDLKSLLEETLKAIQVPDRIRVAIMVDDDLNVHIDPYLMKRVFTNIALNAVQAMPMGGSLTIQASRIEDSFIVSFGDTGVGIPKDMESKVFTPLFTTKSRGQGFGLAVSKRIVESHGGAITFESEEGKGTIFTVRVPSTKQSSH